MPSGVPSKSQRERPRYPCACRCRECKNLVYHEGKVCTPCDLVLGHTMPWFRPKGGQDGQV